MNPLFDLAKGLIAVTVVVAFAALPFMAPTKQPANLPAGASVPEAIEP